MEPLIITSGFVSGFALGLWSAFVAFLSGVARQVVAFLGSLVVVRVTIGTDVGARALTFFCSQTMRRIHLAPHPLYTTEIRYVRALERYAEVAWEVLGAHANIFLSGWRPILMYMNTPDKQNSNGYGVNLIFFRGTFNADKLLIDALNMYNSHSQQRAKNTPKVGYRFRIKKINGRSGRGDLGSKDRSNDNPPSSGYTSKEWTNCRLLRWTEEDLKENIEERDASLVRMSLTTEVDNAVVDARRWLAAREWYVRCHIPWRRGWLLYGPSGTGKSSLVRSIAQDLDIPLYVFNLSSLTSSEFEEAWGEVEHNAPALALFEDLDGVYRGRELVNPGKGAVSFDQFLNALSGVSGGEGVFTVVTTNNLQAIDPALGQRSKDGRSTRPGRLDRILEMPSLTEEGRRKMAARILDGHPEHVDRLVVEGVGDTGAQFEDRCGQLALQLFWGGE